ncbi:angiotensin-converting enzyme-like [Physella acuta]|uniref:angiotensin-converting enzyme-like n=1 Tax=Physella acuta TaxID=109671 RepID=UPI0027DBB43C|nr:angiotensin-converting enzyme-like [Physella acuta]
MTGMLVLLFVTVGLVHWGRGQPGNTDVEDFLTRYNDEAQKVYFADVSAEWNFNTNITDYNQEKMLEQKLLTAKFSQEAYNNASQFNLTNMTPIQRRQFIKIMDIGTSAQRNQTKLARLQKVLSDMESIYSTATVCVKPEKCVHLDPELSEILASSRDYNELLIAWQGWRDVSGAKMKDLFSEYVALSNEAVKYLGHADTGAYWRSWYDDASFKDDVRALFDQVRPLYEHLHAYARRKLKAIYGEDKFPASGHIPAHLLGNMWAQQWNNIYDVLVPFSDKPTLDVTDEMVRQNYTALKIFQTADDFFRSLGMIPMPEEFWNKSLIERPKDGREVVCHASAWDFYNAKDFRIKQCTVINAEDLEVTHHEMGHIQYFLQYKNQTVEFRDGANPGFHEAVGDTISLSVQTQEHMKSINLIKEVGSDIKSDINFLLNMALQKIAFLPFGYLIDQWRWEVFSGDTTKDNYNNRWWEYRCRYQGLSPPVPRNSSHFDPGAKYHIPASVPYIRYFVSFIIQFQFHKALCDVSGYTGPLHRCDIYNNTDAGAKLSEMLRLGSSKPWPEAMHVLTGQYKMDAQPLIDYFKPLMDYLVKENGNDYGWDPHCPTPDSSGQNNHQMGRFVLNYFFILFVPIISFSFIWLLYLHWVNIMMVVLILSIGLIRWGQVQTSNVDVEDFLKIFNEEAQKVYFADVSVEWNFITNITVYNQNAMLDQKLKTAKFAQEAYNNASQFNLTNTTPIQRRQLIKIMDIGTSAQRNQTKLARLQKVISDMESIYSTATLCLKPDKCVHLDPELTEIMAMSTNYNELLKAWQGWRDASGAKMKDLFSEYVALSNDAIKSLGHADTGAYWRSWYDDASFKDDVRALFDQVRPLYEHLHAYARRKLKAIYGEDKFPASGHIPAHLLGNMWAQKWNNIYNILVPFRDKPTMDVTDEMIRQNYTALKIFQTADDFFRSLGMIPVPATFWNESLIEKPKDGRDVVCHPSAWDFFNTQDFRIKQCTVVNHEDLDVAHHEMGHIQYYMQYKNQPHKFRAGANPGFHEAIGDTISLSVQTQEHMKSISLITNLSNENKSDINFLLNMALQKIAFLPFGYLIDQWRWEVFSGETTKDNYNTRWWEYRCRYQGVSPPVPRNSSHFDPGAKYHIPTNIPYMRYFISYVIQFQFHKALCDTSGYTGPLHRCDIYNNTDAGAKLSEMLSLGSSKPWPEAMHVLTGQYKMDAQPLIDYFKPLMDYLVKENGNDYGWDPHCPTLSKDSTPPQFSGQISNQMGSYVLNLMLSFICFSFNTFYFAN